MKKNEKIIYYYFLFLPIIDLFTSLIVNFSDIFVTPGMIIKGVTLLCCIVYIFFFSKSRYKKYSIIYLCLLSVFGITYIFFKNYNLSFSTIAYEGKFAFKYFYFPITLLGMLNIFNDFKISKKLIIKILISNAVIYTILMIIPYVTSTGLNSYGDYIIYEGKKGWFYAANEVGAILTLLLISIYYILNYRKKIYIILILPLMISIAIIGTKVSFLGLIIMTILCLVATLINKKRQAIIPCLIVSIFFIVSLFFSPTLTNFTNLKNNFGNNTSKVEIPEKSNDVKENDSSESNNNKEGIITDKIIYKINKLEDIIPIHFVTQSLRIILSGRDKFLIDNLNVYLTSNIEDKLFGLGWKDREEINYTLSEKLIEIDVADIFIHYGLIGFIIYFLPLLYCIILGIKNIKYFTNETWLSFLTFMTGIGISLFAGHILSAPTVSIYLVLLLGLTIITICEKKEIK